MKTLWLKQDYPGAAKQARQFPDSSHADQTLDADTTVIAPDGSMAAVLLCHIIPLDLHELAFELLKSVKDRPGNRAMAMGTCPLPRSVGLDGKPSPRSGVNKQVLAVSKARHGTLGWDRPDRQTKLTTNNPEMLMGTEPLIKSWILPLCYLVRDDLALYKNLGDSDGSTIF
jgi:hypothetical protein